MRAINRPRRSNCSLSGVLMLSSILAASYTLPFSVASPTARTRNTPCPSITLVPFSTRLVGKVASWSKSSSRSLLWQIGSPVSVDSSTCIDTDSSNSPSAAISSPVANSTMSPTTTSHFGTCCRRPFRMTITGSSSFT